MNLSNLAQIIGDSPTLKLNAKIATLKKAGEPVIHLGGGEPEFPAPLSAVDAIIKKAQSRKIKKVCKDRERRDFSKCYVFFDDNFSGQKRFEIYPAYKLSKIFYNSIVIFHNIPTIMGIELKIDSHVK